MQSSFIRLLSRATFVACICVLSYTTNGQGAAPSLERQIYPGPSDEYLTQLLEFECGEVGTGLEIVKDPDAVSGAYLTATEVFPDAPPTDPTDYVRIAVDTLSDYAFVGFFRVRNPTADSASIWARIDDWEWKRLTFPPDTAWAWQQGGASYRDYLYVGSLENSTATVDIAFATAGLQLDQIFLDNTDAEGSNYYFRPFNYKVKGTNCPDFVNLPPVAGIEPGKEVYASQYLIEATGSYDPNDLIVCYNHVYSRDECDYVGDMIMPEGDNPISVIVRDYYGAKDTATSIWRGIPPTYSRSDRIAYRLEGECGTIGSYWTVAADADRSNGSLAVGGSAESTTGPPADVPENRLRYTVPNVAAADAGRYYLGGSFLGPLDAGNCVWVRINGESWHKWTMISPENSFYPGPAFSLQEGDNTIELAYCSPGLGVDRLLVSPNTDLPNRFFLEDEVIDLGCDGQPEIGEYWLEAECAELGAAWEKNSNAGASQDAYVVKRGDSRYTLPATVDPADYVRFSVAPLVAGTYQLQARIKAAGPLNDSYYVRVNGGKWQPWTSGIRRGEDFSWSVFPGGGVQLVAGENTIDFAYREENTQLDRIYLGPARSPIDGVGEFVFVQGCSGGSTNENRLYLEAECAMYGSAWTPRSDPAARSGGYLVALTDNSLIAPPAAIPENLVTFTFEGPNTIDGKLYFQASIAAPSPDDDSFWVRLNDGQWYAWKTLKRSGEQFEWNRFPLPLRSSRPGETNTLQFAFRESGTRLDRVYLSTLDEVPEARRRSLSCDAIEQDNRTREVECTNYRNAWATVSSNLASNNKYVVFTGERQLDAPTNYDTTRIQEYKIEVGARDDYRLFLRMDAPDVTKNSVWVQLDNGPWIKMWQEVGGAQLLTDGFEWRELNQDGEPVRIFLTGGEQLVRIANREPGTKIDKLYFARETPPFGFGPIAPDCQSPAVVIQENYPRPRTPQLLRSTNDQPTLSLYPNPVADGKLNLALRSTYTGRVEVLVYDGRGRRVLQLPLEKVGEQWQTQLEVSDLPPGVYRVQVLEGEQQTVKTFVRR